MFGLKAAKRTLLEASKEIGALNYENRKYLSEITRLRKAYKEAAMRAGSDGAEIDRVLITERTI